jgi:hypothetical protein
MRFLIAAWMQDGTETRVPEDAIECPGQCWRLHITTVGE